MKKVRGFEKISKVQFLKDFKNFDAVYEDIKIPCRGTKKSAGYDFFSPISFVLKPGESIVVPIGVKVYLMEDEWLGIYSRSGLGFKHNIRLRNQVGIIDADYYNNEGNEGHMAVALKNEGEKNWAVEKGTKIAQSLFLKYFLADDDVVVNKKRTGGIGSTGRKWLYE